MRPFLPTLLLLPCALHSADLPNTKPWQFPADIVAEQYRELRTFYESRITAAAESRREFARQPPALQRAKLREITGAVDTPLAPVPTRTPLGPNVTLLTWPILRIGDSASSRGAATSLVRAHALLLEPPSAQPRPAVIYLPDAVRPFAQIPPPALDLAHRGYTVLVPLLTQRRAFSEPWLDDRQWLMRLGYQTGRHIFGADLLQVQSAHHLLRTLPTIDPARIAIAGHGQGALTALYAAALDPRYAAVLSAPDPTPDWDQPQDRTLWQIRMFFSDDQLIALAKAHPTFDLPWLDTKLHPTPAAITAPALDTEQFAALANAQFTQWQAFFRNKALEAADTLPPAGPEKREAYLDLIGRYPPAAGPLDARSTLVYDRPGFTGHRLSIRVYDDVHAYGILLVPKSIRPGERRPVVFVEHGLAGRPESALGVDPNPRDDAVYSRFGLRLVERGYIVFAPMIATQSHTERNHLIRRAHLTGLIPAGMDVRKFGRVLDYLSTLPFVDPARFAFYGLSYGGYTALWTGPAEPRFRAVITSGHFNDWNTKTTDLTLGTSFLFFADTLDQFNFGLLNRFNHADLAALIAPRCFMIEIGDQDPVEVLPRHLVDREIDRALATWRRLGIPEKGQASRFAGPHKIDGTGTYPFLDRCLEWSPTP